MPPASHYVRSNSPRSARTAVLPPNNFDLIRLLLAIDVFFLHLATISGSSVFAPISRWANAFQTKGSFSVPCFFVISGFLIFMSYDRTPSLKSYVAKRIRRIYPAYLVLILICAIFGCLVSTFPLDQYFSTKLLRYLAANLTFLTFLCPSLPGVFASNIAGPVVNGALWTLKVEVAFYVAVPLIVSCFRWLPRHIVLPTLYIASTIYRFYFQQRGDEALANQLPGQLAFFIAGAIVYVYLGWFMKHFWYVAVVAGALLYVEGMAQVSVLYPLCLAVITLFLAFSVPVLHRFAPKWDLSYGIYIWHFPILQLVYSRYVFMSNPVWGAFVSAAFTLLVGCLSWTTIERRMLRNRRRRPIITVKKGEYASGFELSVATGH